MPKRFFAIDSKVKDLAKVMLEEFCFAREHLGLTEVCYKLLNCFLK